MIGKNIEFAAELLQQGKLVAIPTETVYGLAGNALNEKAVLDIFKVKNRPHFDPLIIHVDTLQKIEIYVNAFPEKALTLATMYMPGPLTLLLPKKNIPDLVTAGSEYVAVRIPKHPVAQKLLSLLNFPLAAPSANPFGYISPTRAEHVQTNLGEQIPYILDGGICQIGIESTIVGFENDEPIILRKGGLAIEAIEKAIGKVKVLEHSSSNPSAPGMLKSHYAPRKKLYIGNIPDLIVEHQNKKIGILSFKKSYPEASIHKILSPLGSLEEASLNFFHYLRELDASGVDIILSEWLPNQGLGNALNDRLKRASA